MSSLSRFFSRAYQRFVSGLLFPLHEYIKGHETIRVYRDMEATQWLSPQEIADLQIVNLRNFLQCIGKDVPYFKQLFSKLDFSPDQVTSLADLQQLPFMDKPTIRANTDDLKAIGASTLSTFNTGGSSGEPLIFFLGKERVSHDVAAKRRATRWWGVDIGDPEIVVWGSPVELGAQDRMRLIRDRIFRTELLSAFEMSDRNLDRFISRIEEVRPASVFGYPSSLSAISEHARQRGKHLDGLGVKVVFVTSESLYQHQRENIERAFGCPVANGYGGRDAGFIAHECPEGQLHVTSEDLVVEIVDSGGHVLPAGESGEIVVTHLRTSEYPFVRYRTGDIGVLSDSPCACGRGLQVMSSVQGRTTDFVIAMDGTVLHGLALIYVLRDIPGVEVFRIIQETLEHTRVEVVAHTVNRDELIEKVDREFRRRLGEQVRVSVEFLTSIPREKSGKFRYVTSRVDSVSR